MVETNGQRGRGEIGISKVRVAGVRHMEAPGSTRQRGQVLPIPVEIRAGVECAEWNW
jgi:hypothetical protein